jgi:hypothetical protein
MLSRNLEKTLHRMLALVGYKRLFWVFLMPTLFFAWFYFSEPSDFLGMGFVISMIVAANFHRLAKQEAKKNLNQSFVYSWYSSVVTVFSFVAVLLGVQITMFDYLQIDKVFSNTDVLVSECSVHNECLNSKEGVNDAIQKP